MGKTMTNGRRLKQLQVAPELLDRFIGGAFCRGFGDLFGDYATEGWPLDARIVGCSFDARRYYCVFLVESQEFPLIDMNIVGVDIPLLTVLYRKVEPQEARAEATPPLADKSLHSAMPRRAPESLVIQGPSGG